MNDIRPEYLTLAELLHRRLFEIPDYQRAYSWGSKERKDLFNDIKKIALNEEGNQKHFMATIVCLHRKTMPLGTDVYARCDIVDGQQRLTTLILLLNAIRLALDPKQERIVTEISELLVKPGGDRLLLLQTNHDSSHHFSNFLREGKSDIKTKGKTLADQELLAAIHECQKFVENWIEEERELLHLYACIKNRLSFIFHLISDEKIVYTVFEVLNSRGMDVSWLDRLKSMLMGKAFELQNADRDQLIADLHDIWRKIYARIGLRQGLNTEALRFAATLYQSDMPNRPLSEKDAVDGVNGLRANAHDAKSIRKVAHWLLRVTDACDKVISNRRQNAVTRISQARLLAVAIYLRDDIHETDQSKLMNRWEKVSFRIYGMMRHDARTGVGDYVRLAWRITEENLSVSQIYSGIQFIGENYPIEKAIEELRHANCYERWQNELRYFMFRYEEYLTKKAGNNFKNEQWERIWEASPSDSIEHIIPQSTAPDDIRHILGNLMILPPDLNKKLGNKKPKMKLGEYRKTGLLSAIEVADQVASQSRWRKSAVREREEKLLEWAKVEWGDCPEDS